MRKLIARWQSLNDAEMDRISAALVGIHFVMLGLLVFASTIGLPLLLGVSPEVVMSRLMYPVF